MANKNTKQKRKLNPTVTQPRLSKRAKVAAKEQTGDMRGPTIMEQMELLGWRPKSR